MATRKVDVKDLRLGMYVARLDRAWVDSPFLFQGFFIETEEDLEKLRETCRYVFIDEEKQREREKEEERGGAVGGRVESRKDEVKPGSAAYSEIHHAGVREELRQASEVRERTRKVVSDILEQVRLDREIDPKEARQAVISVVDTVTTNPNAAMWLTNLKKQLEDTATHSLNTCILSVAFAKHLGYEGEVLEEIGLGALLHDVGKMKVPDRILKKPGKLTEEEFRVMKRHPIEGFNVMRLTRGVPARALEIIRYHHERISGEGYPDGLDGDALDQHILLVAICEVYDEITSDRIYKKALPAHKGLTVMNRLALKDFGRDLMAEFIKFMGVYPIGSLVRLSSGAIGIVMSANPNSRLRPVVMLLRDPDGKPFHQRPLVNLAALARHGKAGQWYITDTLDPAAHGIDMERIVTEQMEA